MTYQNISLSQLRLNVANDRHGPMASDVLPANVAKMR